MFPHGNPAVGQTMGTTSGDFTPPSTGADGRLNAQATLTSTPAVATPTNPTNPAAPTKKKCTKKKHTRSVASAKKKCKKHKKK